MEQHDGQYLGDPGVFGLSPEEATAKLAALKTEFEARNAPAPTTPGNQRLQQMLSDPKIRDAYLTGHPSITREIQELMAGGAELDIGGIETVYNGNQTKRIYDGLMDGLRLQGLAEGAERFIRAADDGAPVTPSTQGDRIAAERARSRLLAGKTVEDLTKDFQLRSDVADLNAFIASAAEDGQPVRESVKKLLIARGLWS